MFRDYKGEIMWSEVAFASFIVLSTCLLIFIFISGYASVSKQMEEHKAFKEKCIDAGGAPVSPFDYIKGHGEGYLCINPSAIIQLKD